MASFSGALVWPFIYPWPQKSQGLVEAGFDELRVDAILDHCKDIIDVCYEVHPGEDLHDDYLERFLEATNNHSSVNLLMILVILF